MFLEIEFFEDPKSIEYKRQVFSLLDCFGSIGGLSDMFDTIGGFLVGIFSAKLFLFSILSSLYQVDTSSKICENNEVVIESDESSENKHDSQKPCEELKVEEIFNKGTQGNHCENSQKSINEFNNTQRDIDINSNYLNSEFVKCAAESMRMRFRYSYSFSDLAYNFLFPFKCLSNHCRRGALNIHDRYVLFQKGQRRLAKELDVVAFARTQRKLKMMMHSLMDTSGQLLAPFQKTNAISLMSDTDSNLTDDQAYSKIPKIFCDNVQKQKHIAFVNRFLIDYANQANSEKDENLLLGVYTLNKQNSERQLSYTIKNKNSIHPSPLNTSINCERKVDLWVEESKFEFNRNKSNINQSIIFNYPKINQEPLRDSFDQDDEMSIATKSKPNTPNLHLKHPHL